MTFKEISEMIASIGLPYAYYEFPDNTGQAPPFICFWFPRDNDFKADGTNYQKIERLVIELYTDNKDFAQEAAVESVLSANGLVYTRNETHIDSERMYEVVYETDVIITPEPEPEPQPDPEPEPDPDNTDTEEVDNE